MSIAKEIRAAIITNRARGTATLEWRVLLGERTEILRASDFGPLERGEEDWEEEIVIPTYGEVLASTERPIEEFFALDRPRSLTAYVESHLPRPAA